MTAVRYILLGSTAIGIMAGCAEVPERTFDNLPAEVYAAPPAPAPEAAPEPERPPLPRVQRIGAATVYAYDRDETYDVRVRPGRLTVLQLGKGEQLTGQPVIGDTDRARWMVDLTRGANDSVVVQAGRVGLSTNLFVTTTGGDYQIDLASVGKRGMSRVRWIYPEPVRPKPPPEPAVAFDPAAVPASFTIKGDAKWRPEQVSEHGGKTYIVFPQGLGPMVAAPALFAVTATGLSPISFRVENGRIYVIDQRLNVGRLVLDGETVEIKRKN